MPVRRSCTAAPAPSRIRIAALCAGVILAALVAAGCGDDKEASSPSASAKPREAQLTGWVYTDEAAVDAEVVVEGASGKPIEDSVSSSTKGGRFRISTKVGNRFTVVASGVRSGKGKVDGDLRATVDRLSVDIPVHVSLFSTVVAAYLDKNPKSTVADAVSKVGLTMAIPLGYSQTSIARSPEVFSADRFLVAASKSGGVQALAEEIAEEASKKSPAVTSYGEAVAGVAEGPGGAEAGAGGAAEGEAVAAEAAEAEAANPFMGPAINIGVMVGMHFLGPKIFGDPNAEIDRRLDQIEDTLLDIEDTLNQLNQQIRKTDADVLSGTYASRYNATVGPIFTRLDQMIDLERDLLNCSAPTSANSECDPDPAPTCGTIRSGKSLARLMAQMEKGDLKTFQEAISGDDASSIDPILYSFRKAHTTADGIYARADQDLFAAMQQTYVDRHQQIAEYVLGYQVWEDFMEQNNVSVSADGDLTPDPQLGCSNTDPEALAKAPTPTQTAPESEADVDASIVREGKREKDWTTSSLDIWKPQTLAASSPNFVIHLDESVQWIDTVPSATISEKSAAAVTTAIGVIPVSPTEIAGDKVAPWRMGTSDEITALMSVYNTKAVDRGSRSKWLASLGLTTTAGNLNRTAKVAPNNVRAEDDIPQYTWQHHYYKTAKAAKGGPYPGKIGSNSDNLVRHYFTAGKLIDIDTLDTTHDLAGCTWEGLPETVYPPSTCRVMYKSMGENSKTSGSKPNVPVDLGATSMLNRTLTKNQLTQWVYGPAPSE